MLQKHQNSQQQDGSDTMLDLITIKSSQEHLHAKTATRMKTEAMAAKRPETEKACCKNEFLLTTIMNYNLLNEMKEVNPYKRKHETLKAKTLKNYKAPK